MFQEKFSIRCKDLWLYLFLSNIYTSCLFPILFLCLIIPRTMLNNNVNSGPLQFLFFIHSLFIQHLLCSRNCSGPWKRRCDQVRQKILKRKRREVNMYSKETGYSYTLESKRSFPWRTSPIRTLSVFHHEIWSLLFLINTPSKERKFLFILCLLKAFKKIQEWILNIITLLVSICMNITKASPF